MLLNLSKLPKCHTISILKHDIFKFTEHWKHLKSKWLAFFHVTSGWYSERRKSECKKKPCMQEVKLFIVLQALLQFSGLDWWTRHQLFFKKSKSTFWILCIFIVMYALFPIRIIKSQQKIQSCLFRPFLSGETDRWIFR